MFTTFLYLSLCLFPGYLVASRLFMVLALGGGIVAWVTTIVALLQHRARWLVCSAVCYAIQGIGSVRNALSLCAFDAFVSCAFSSVCCVCVCRF